MRLEDLTIALRPRSPWEATDLGIALTRRHARVIYATWLLVTLPYLAIATAIGYALDWVYIGWFLLWWAKPAFDRIPLYILSRAVFGATPTVREALRAQADWGWRPMLHWLTWRRLHPGRALLLCVDLLEGVTGRQRSDRARVLSRSHGSNNVMLTVIGANIDFMLNLSILALALMFIPLEFLDESAQAMWDTLVDAPPAWAEALGNFVAWIAIGIVEPFYVGAGFGLYLNRRTQLEAWDLELAFRRLASRLTQAAAALVLAIAVVPLAVAPARADDDKPVLEEVLEQAIEEIEKGEKPKKDAKDAPQLSAVFGDEYRDDGAAFEKAVAKTFESDDLHPTETISTWEERNKKKRDVPKQSKPDLSFFEVLGAIVGFIAEFGWWIVIGLLVLLVLRYAQQWMPWLTERFERAVDDAIVVHELPQAEALPDDVPAAVRALWQQGSHRAALALFYRAGVRRLADTLGAPLPTGATEADCLRYARKLGENPYRALFTRIVRAWQAHAYAERPATTADLEAMLGDWIAAARPASAETPA